MMKRAVVFTLIVCGALSALSLAEEEKNSSPSATVSPAEEFSYDPPKPTTKSTPKPTTTTTPKPTTTTTPKPTTTTTPKPTTTTTPKPTTTTTPKPTTTTTTTPKPTTTTTPKPTTTPTPKPTTTTTPKPTTPPPPKPTPPTDLRTGKYNVTTDKNVICLVAQMALRIRLETPKAKGNFTVQPNMTRAEGGCRGTTANLTLVFKEGHITFMFNKSADNFVYVDALSFNLYYPLTTEGTTRYAASNNSVHLFSAKVGHSYSCKKEALDLGNGLYLDVDQDQMQAFNLTKSSEFGTPDPCVADRSDYRVAIAVGVTLLVLIVIVVVAYLLGRKKRTNGYQSL